MAKLKEVTLRKEFKLGLPNYSNQTVGIYMTWEVGEGEEFNFNNGWDTINHEINVQADNHDPAWMNVKELKDKYKATINIPKSGGGE